jgi:FkbM family methyltransferase
MNWRLRFLWRKYLVLLRVLAGQTPVMQVGPMSMVIRDVSGLGTLQSTVLDTNDSFGSVDILGRQDPIVVDVGANVGQFTNAIKLLYPGARVIAFEPDPDVFQDLRLNTATLGQIELHNVALGAEFATLLFHRHLLSGMSSFTPIAEASLLKGSLALEVKRMDDVISDDIAPDLVKIDVEGHELETVRGASSTLSRTRFLLIEIGLNRQSGRNNLQLLRAIAEIAPEAHVLKFGRPLGDAARPDCQDVLIEMRP